MSGNPRVWCVPEGLATYKCGLRGRLTLGTDLEARRSVREIGWGHCGHRVCECNRRCWLVGMLGDRKRGVRRG